MAQAHSADTLVRNVFLLTIAGVIAEIIAMFVMPHLEF